VRESNGLAKKEENFFKIWNYSIKNKDRSHIASG
jgi:hypothetical protein